VGQTKALKMSEIVLVKYLFKEDWAPLQEVIGHNPDQFADIYEVASEKELLTIIDNSPAVLVIAGVTGKEALASVLGFLKGQRRVIKEANVKFSAVNFINNKQVEAALMKLGCQEVMDPTMREKALKFKIDFWKKALAVGQKKEADVKLTLKDKQLSDAQAKVDVNPIKWIEPIKCVDDMWIMKSTSDAKKVLTRWMVKVVGPSPFVAQWTEVPGQRGVWKFNFKEGIRDAFHSGDGDWYFKGDQKPEFVWKENIWMISGVNFQLFYQEAEGVTPRFVSTQKGIEISKNSSYALSREGAITDSFDQEILVKKGLKIDDSKTEIEEDQKGEGLLTQDLSGEEAISTKYKGATSGTPEAEAEEKKKLAIDSKTAGRLKGKSSTDDLGEANYSGDVEKNAAEEKKAKKHDGSADRLDNSHGDAGIDNIGPDKYKGKTAHDQTERKSNYGGASETDDLGSDKWSNATDGQHAQKKEKSPRERGVYSEEATSPYAGESNTDDLGPAHWEGKNSNEAKKKASEEESSGWAEEKKNGMKGKGSTDDLGAAHYSGKNGKQKEQLQAEKERPHLAELGAKGSEEGFAGEEITAKKKKESVTGTDDLGSAHYNGKIGKAERPVAEEEKETKGFAEKAKKPLAGKSDTDDLGAGHYGGKVQKAEVAEAKETERSSARAAKAAKDLSGKTNSDDLGPAHYKGKQAAEAEKVAKETPVSEAVAQKAASAKAKEAAPVQQKKINKLDDLFPEGNAEDPQGDVLPKMVEKDEPLEVDVPIERTGPRLVVNNTPVGVPKHTQHVEDKIQPVAVEESEVQVSNDQVTVRAFLKKKTQPNVEHIVNVDDFFDNTVIVKMMQGMPQDGEQVTLHISFEYQKRSKRIQVEGKCIGLDDDGEGQSYCTLELQASDVKVFEQFMTLYRLRQQHVTQFLKAAKGY
jgi:hypothetical protein